ncbi:hypothetical protein AcV7_002339 [Taiwanofungus camphoratus]|nr:hypothetical protein AcV7_002339 [Antrodia cinnamomea]
MERTTKPVYLRFQMDIDRTQSYLERKTISFVHYIEERLYDKCCHAQWLLYGFTCAQTVFYLRNYHSDGKILKVLVLVFWCIDTSRTILDAQSMWFSLIEDHGTLAIIFDVSRVISTFAV